ncbi:uncharacterized protein LOC142639506 [Castanea sativa]|uniref:uncharacterized protein LOC142639506 n=1 Tax=Castanea sativa TaxID=21020 RepID=UPI003F651FE1
MDPLQYLMAKPVQDEKAAKLVLLLSEFDIKYVTKKSMKGRAIADHLAHCSPEEAEEIQGDFPEEDIMEIEVESWKMYFGGATSQSKNGIGVLLISPKGTHIPFSGKLNFPATNNATKYEACIMGPQVALGLGVKELEINIIYRYGVPHEIISDNGLHLKGETEKLLRQFNIQHHKSSPYRHQTNGAVDAANKNIG